MHGLARLATLFCLAIAGENVEEHTAATSYLEQTVGKTTMRFNKMQ